MADIAVVKTKSSIQGVRLPPIHTGFFYYAKTALDCIAKIQLEMGISSQKIWLTGHSLGAAIATIAGYVMHKQGFDVRVDVCGSPKVGGLRWWFASRGLRLTRVVIEGDPVAHLPPIVWPFPPRFPWYLHAGRKIQHKWTGAKTIESLYDRHQPAAYQQFVGYSL